MPVDTLSKEHHCPGIWKKNATSWTNGPTGASWRSAKAKAKFCHWDGITPCCRTGCTPAGQTAALQKMTQDPCGQKVEYESVCPCSQRGNSILGYRVWLQPADWQRWSFPSVQHLGDIWRPVPSPGHSSARKTLMCWSKSSKSQEDG